MRFKPIFALLLTILILPSLANAQAQNPTADVVMVLPFENTLKPFRPEYNWVGESFADALAELLNKPGLVVVSSDERELAYQQLRLPETVIPSRATAIKLARQAKATMIVVGNYSVTPPATNNSDKQAGDAYVQVTSRVIKVNEGRTLGEVLDGGWATRQFDYGGLLTTLQDIHGRLAYQILYNATRRCPIRKTRSFRKRRRYRRRLLRLM